MVSIVTARPAEADADVAGNVGLLGGQGVIALADSVELVIDQLPEPSAVAVPSTVVPLVSIQRHRGAGLGAAAGERRRGVVGEVVGAATRRYPIAAARSGADGAAAVVSIVTARPAEAALMLPAMSVCLAVSV